jgi:membrane carboxypeptidase/penicillin-binding protein
MRRLVLTVLALTVSALAGVMLYVWNDVRIARGETQTKLASAFQTYGRKLAVQDVSAPRMVILLKVEDPKFFDHKGVDLQTPGAGMTTISQGLVKLLYFPDGFQPGLGKIRQTLIARYAFDAQVSKDEQLLLFLNASYLGTENGQAVHGFEQASQVYFGRSFVALSDDEYLVLVGMLIAPNALKPGSAASAERVKRIKRYLSGEVVPASVLDVEYNGKTSGTHAEEGLMMLLRMLVAVKG